MDYFAAPLLWVGIGLFLIGVAVAVFGGEDLQMVGLAIQVAGAIECRHSEER